MPDSHPASEKSLFGIKPEDILRIVKVNYSLILIEGVFGAFLVYYFHVIPLWLLLEAILGTLIPSLILHLMISLKLKRVILESMLLVVAICTVLALTIVVHYFPEVRPSFLLIFLPTIIFGSSQSLSFGVANLIIILASLALMFGVEISGGQILAKGSFDIASQTAAWKVGTAFSTLILAIIGFMSIYFSSILQKRQAENLVLAEANKKLYQQSKTTSDEILKNMRESLIVLDNHFRIVQYNSALTEILAEKKDLTNFPVRDLPLFFTPKLMIYLEDFKKNTNTDRFSFKVQDELKNMYDVGIAKIDLKKNEPGFMIMINQNPLPWGLIFDSATKKPVDLALVRLHNAEDDRIIETRASDKDGRFGFIVAEGKYKISVTKEGYSFPSKSTEGYIGEEIKVESAADSFLNIKIPMDRTSA